jgi:predicted metal-dependent enzyme (double-stranded beta helix superfamily)
MLRSRYTISQLVADLRRVSGGCSRESDVLSAVRPLAQRAAASRDLWLEERFFEVDSTQGFTAYRLHAEPDGGLIVVAQSWLPQRGAPPHDHGTWGVIAGVHGPEKNEFYERIDDRSRPGYAELRRIGEKVVQAGEVLCMPTGLIHSVLNESNEVSVSLHIYGRDLNTTGRSQFDLEAKTMRPFFVNVEP